MIYFTSDTHFYHKRIIGFQEQRAYFRCKDLPHIVDAKGEISHADEVAAMNERIIAGWNSVVSATDIIYHLGDLSFGSASKTSEILSRLNGLKYLIMGNHDWKRTCTTYNEYFEEVFPHYHELKIDDKLVCLMHYPILSWNQAERGSIHLHGHLHGNKDIAHAEHHSHFKTLDIGIDNHPAFRPWSWPEILKKMEKRINLTRHEVL